MKRDGELLRETTTDSLSKLRDDGEPLLENQQEWPGELYTVKPVLSGHSKIDKTMVLTTNGSLMKVESIAECSLGEF